MSQTIRTKLICVGGVMVFLLMLNCDEPDAVGFTDLGNQGGGGLDSNKTVPEERPKHEENTTPVALSTNLFEIGVMADVTFFGLQAYGTKHVFVLDSSGSMGVRMGAGSRFDKQKGEVIRTLRAFKPEVKYAVIFYDRIAHFEGSLNLKPATQDNIDQTVEWINAHRLGVPNRVMEGMRPATSLECHTIYLLSDGMSDLNAAQVRHEIRAMNVDGKIHINTIGLQDSFGRSLMEQIATDNGGQFKFIP